MKTLETTSGLKIYRSRELSARLGISEVTIWRMRQRGEFPNPVRLSPDACGWPADVVDLWLTNRASAPDVLRQAV